MIQDELLTLCETLSAGVGNDRRREARGKSSDIPLLVMDPRWLLELLQICTLIAQGQKHLCLGIFQHSCINVETVLIFFFMVTTALLHFFIHIILYEV